MTAGKFRLYLFLFACSGMAAFTSTVNAQDFVVTAPYTSPDDPYYSTCGAGNDCEFPAEEVGYGEDHTYEVHIPHDGFWHFYLCNGPETFDSVMALGTSPCANDLVFNDDGCGDETLLSDFTVYLTAADGPYYLTVDGFDVEDCGEYQISIEEGLEPASCPEDAEFSQPPYLPDEFEFTGDFSDVNAYGNGMRYYENFSMPNHACTIRFWGFALDSNYSECSENPMTFTITFFTNGADNKPGDMVCTGVYPVEGNDTGLVFNINGSNAMLKQYDVDLGFCCPINDGWISIQAMPGLDPDCWFYWMGSPVGMDQTCYYENGDGSADFGFFDLSLCISYIPSINCIADLDGDGDTDQADLGILLAAYGNGGAVGDLDGDGDTDQSDLGILLSDYGCVPE